MIRTRKAVYARIIRILDEAMTNAVKHANAKRIAVSIETVKDEAGTARGCIMVEDDGKGFAVAEDGHAAQDKTSRGLRNMQNRAARCGAELAWASGGSGTRVRLTLPRRFPDGDAGAG